MSQGGKGWFPLARKNKKTLFAAAFATCLHESGKWKRNYLLAKQSYWTWKSCTRSSDRSDENENHMCMFVSHKYAVTARAQFGVETTGNVGFILNACVLQHFCTSIFRRANKINISHIYDYIGIHQPQKAHNFRDLFLFEWRKFRLNVK